MEHWVTHTQVKVEYNEGQSQFQISKFEYFRQGDLSAVNTFANTFQSSLAGINNNPCCCASSNSEKETKLENILASIKDVLQRDKLKGIHYTRIRIESSYTGESNVTAHINQNGILKTKSFSLNEQLKKMVEKLKVQLVLNYLSQKNVNVSEACKHNYEKVQKELASMVKHKPVCLNLKCCDNKLVAENLDHGEMQILNVDLGKKINSWLKKSISNDAHGFPHAFFKSEEKQKAVEPHIEGGPFPKSENIGTSQVC